MFSLSVPSACVRVAAAAAVECCSWLVWEGKQQSLNLPGGCGTGAGDSNHTLHCWQHSSTAQSLPNLASAYKQGLGSGLAEVSWWFMRFPWALSFQICISQDLGLLSLCLWSTHSWCSGRWPEASEGLQAAGWVCEGI